MVFTDTIGLQRGDVLALVGAGGKTALSLLLGIEMLSNGEPVACCATTMTLLPAPDSRIRTIFTGREDTAQAVREALRAGQLPWIAGDTSDECDPSPDARGCVVCPVALTDAKVRGADAREIDCLHAALPDATLVVEADGARHRWLKAPAEHEPQLPVSTSVLSPVAHLGIIGKPLAAESVHRPERVCRLLGVPMGAEITPEMVAAVIAHSDGGLKGYHEGMRAVPILTLCDSCAASADSVAGLLLKNSIVSHVVVAWLGENPWAKAICRPARHSERSEESPDLEDQTLRFTQGDRRREGRVFGVLLAAGGSARLGRPKQLFPFGGRTLVEHALDILLRSRVHEIIVVLGAHANEIAPLLREPRVRIVRNLEWELGQSTSLRAALHALPPDCAAVVFAPCDMPFITPEIIGELIRAWRATGNPVVAAASGDMRGIPALFAREMFPELRRVSGDRGGRALLEKHPERVGVVQVPAGVLIDIDTPDSYREAVNRLELDRQGVQMHPLKSIRNLIIDMDGVLYRGETPVPGIVPFFQFLRDRDIHFLLATNNSTLTQQQYSEKMARMGVQIPPEAVLTSAIAAADYLAARYSKGTRIHAVGETGLKDALTAAGFVLADKDVAVVVVGMDRQFNWEKTSRATLLIRAGATFIGTNPDKTLPMPDGEVPGNGSLLALLEAASGASPTIIGKPEKHLYEIAMKRLGAPLDATAALGDRLETDILGASRMGLFSILVLSGVSTGEEAAASSYKPDLTFQDVGELARVWDSVLRG